MKAWKRWDPRLGRMPLREVKLAKRWVIEVVPDLFEPGHEALADATFRAIGALRYQKHESVGRFMLRTAYPTEAAAALRRISDRERHSMGSGSLREVPSRLVLALYAETQAQLDERVALLFAPRIKCEEVALTDPVAGLALALKEGWIYADSYWRKEQDEALAKGPAAVSTFLRDKVSCNRTDGIPVDSGGLALYLSPREKIDIRAILSAGEDGERRHGRYPQHTFDWVICAGRVGPLSPENPYRVDGPRADDPHPMHPGWIRRVANAAHDAAVPFCVPYLGEWADVDVNIDGPSSDVDYEPGWEWGQRGWDNEHRDAKPHSATMQAVGFALAGREVDGHVYDQWPGCWCHR